MSDIDMCYFHEHETWEELKVCRSTRGKGIDDEAMAIDYSVDDFGQINGRME